MKYENCSTHSSKENQDQNHVILNPDVYQEQQEINEPSEIHLKTSSRPQRQAAKKAENQIRVNK